MTEIPSIWRTELWHPLSVHLPIAVLFLVTFVGVIEFFVKKQQKKSFFRQTKSWLFGLGIVTVWIAIYTGTWAYNIEVRKLCDPGVLQNHQWWGYAVALIYSVVGLIELIFHFELIKKAQRVQRIVVVVLLLAGASGMAYVGHLGASLVYQQGAGTYQPSEDCHEFE